MTIPGTSDRVQLLKRESNALGGDDADNNPFGGPEPIDPEEDAIEAKGAYFQEAGARDETVALYRESGRLMGFDTVKTTPIAILDTVTEGQHRTFDQLVHLIAEDSFVEPLYTGFRLSGEITWTDATKTTKIREVQYTRTFGRITQVVVTQYDGAGVVAETLTETITYTGARIASVTRVLT